MATQEMSGWWSLTTTTRVGWVQRAMLGGPIGPLRSSDPLTPSPALTDQDDPLDLTDEDPPPSRAPRLAPRHPIVLSTPPRRSGQGKGKGLFGG